MKDNRMCQQRGNSRSQLGSARRHMRVSATLLSLENLCSPSVLRARFRLNSPGFEETAIISVSLYSSAGNSLSPYAQLPARYHSLVASTPGSVLLQTSRFDAENYRSYLFVRPSRMLWPGSALFDEIEHALAGGAYVAGFFAYECGESLKNLGRCELQNTNMPPAWFGVYPQAFIFDHRTGEFEGKPPDDLMAERTQFGGDFEIRNLHLGLSGKSYAEKIAAIQEYIRAGDTYQVNFTDKLHFDFSGSPEAMFAALAIRQPVQFSAFLHDENWYILSFSPELFFRVKDRRIVTRPMKGTARRGADSAEDKAIALWLQNDLKNRSENVMIVDLLRNDLGRVCEYGSVRVEQLFTVEKYETLFQLTSEISGSLRPAVSYSEIFESLFPCGSVTGAPKHRTIEIIQELEQGPRGVYTGAIGFFSPQREAVFNVPIRTVALQNSHGEMGVGSGIVIDSEAEDEFRECLLKSEFLTRCDPPFQLMESILWDDGYRWLPLHLERMESSSAYFGFNFDRERILAALDDERMQLPCGEQTKVRVLLDRSGAVTVSPSPVEKRVGTGKVIVSASRVSSGDPYLQHKTTRRQFYDQQYAQARAHGYDEVLFLNEHAEVTEGAISNVFIEKEGQWFTPPVACGLLPGIYRRHVLETRLAFEKPLRLEDLVSADAVYICNAVRGCRKIIVVQASIS
jgi:para-aminobenzoate synthetase / 4-amino-4-deoxychorismate lyase